MPRLESVVQVVDGDVTSVTVFQDLESALYFAAQVVVEQCEDTVNESRLAVARRELRISREWVTAGFQVYVMLTKWGTTHV